MNREAILYMYICCRYPTVTRVLCMYASRFRFTRVYLLLLLLLQLKYYTITVLWEKFRSYINMQVYPKRLLLLLLCFRMYVHLSMETRDVHT